MWAGRIICGFLGLMTGGFPGLVLGFFVGYFLDRLLVNAELRADSSGYIDPAQQQAIVFRVTFSLLGKMAKSDGRVSEEEVAHVETLMTRMRLSPEARQEAISYFSQGKSPTFNFEQALRDFRQVSRVSSAINLMLVEMLVQMAMVDGEIAAGEKILLSRIAEGLNVSRWQLQLMMARYRGGAYDHFSNQQGHQSNYTSATDIDSAYATLGVEKTASMSEIKKAYRRLMSKHHPDKLQGEGVTEQMLELAKERAQQIQAAYDVIKKQKAGN